MDIEHLYEEKDVAFWMIPKFIPLLFKNTQSGYLYSLLRAKRVSLVRRNKLKSYKEWFYYPEDWLKNDLREPNSPNHIIKLLKELKQFGLIDFKNDKYRPYTRRYWINDEKFVELAKEYAKEVDKLRKEYFDKKSSSSEVKQESIPEQKDEDEYDIMGLEVNYVQKLLKRIKAN